MYYFLVVFSDQTRISGSISTVLTDLLTFPADRYWYLHVFSPLTIVSKQKNKNYGLSSSVKNKTSNKKSFDVLVELFLYIISQLSFFLFYLVSFSDNSKGLKKVGGNVISKLYLQYISSNNTQKNDLTL